MASDALIYETHSGDYYDVNKGWQKGEPYKLEPVRTLIRLSRVSHVFKATIADSPSLALSRECDAALKPIQVQLLLPLQWLVQQSLGIGWWFRRRGIEPSCYIWVSDTQSRKALKAFLNSGESHKSASWRQVKVYWNCQEDVKIYISFDGNPPHPASLVVFKDGTTLEAYLEKICEALYRTSTENLTGEELEGMRECDENKSCVEESRTPRRRGRS